MAETRTVTRTRKQTELGTVAAESIAVYSQTDIQTDSLLLLAPTNSDTRQIATPLPSFSPLYSLSIDTELPLSSESSNSGQNGSSSKKESAGFPWYILVAIGAAALILGLVTLFFWKKRKRVRIQREVTRSMIKPYSKDEDERSTVWGGDEKNLSFLTPSLPPPPRYGHQHKDSQNSFMDLSASAHSSFTHIPVESAATTTAFSSKGSSPAKLKRRSNDVSSWYADFDESAPNPFASIRSYDELAPPSSAYRNLRVPSSVYTRDSYQDTNAPTGDGGRSSYHSSAFPGARSTVYSGLFFGKEVEKEWDQERLLPTRPTMGKKMSSGSSSKLRVYGQAL